MNELAQILIKIAILLNFSFFTYSFPVLKADLHIGRSGRAGQSEQHLSMRS